MSYKRLGIRTLLVPLLGPLPRSQPQIAYTQVLDPEYPYSTLLVDAANGFNKLGRKALFWTIQHKWPHRSQFTFNCYWHSAQLVL